MLDGILSVKAEDKEYSIRKRGKLYCRYCYSERFEGSGGEEARVVLLNH